MTAEVIKLSDKRPVPDIAHLVLCKHPTEGYKLYLTWADEEFIESLPNISARFEKLFEMTKEALPSLIELADDFRKDGD
jgi:hypothetical protein